MTPPNAKTCGETRPRPKLPIKRPEMNFTISLIAFSLHNKKIIPANPRASNPCDTSCRPITDTPESVAGEMGRCPDGYAKRAHDPRGCVKGGSPPVRENGPGVPGGHTVFDGPGPNPAGLKGLADKRPGWGIEAFLSERKAQRNLRSAAKDTETGHIVCHLTITYLRHPMCPGRSCRPKVADTADDANHGRKSRRVKEKPRAMKRALEICMASPMPFDIDRLSQRCPRSTGNVSWRKS